MTPWMADGAARFLSGAAWRRALVFAALGGVIGLGQAPLGWPIAGLLGLLCVFLLFSRLTGTKQAVWAGWQVATGMYLATLFWIVEPFMVDAATTGWMAPFALVFMAGGLALFWALAFGVAFRLGRDGRGRTAALVVMLGLAGLARAYVLTGFPWGLLGYIWADTPVAQLAAFVGPHGLSVLTLLLAALPVVSGRLWSGAAVSALALGGVWMLGAQRLNDGVAARPLPVNLRLVQPNAAQDEKWDPKMMPVFFDRQLALTAAPWQAVPGQGGGGKAPDLVIWPETAIPFLLGDAPGAQARIAAAAPPGSRVIIGAQRAEGRRYFNSLALLGKTGAATQVYDKAHLVPFGEYIPFGGFLARFGIQGLAASAGGGFTSGGAQPLLDLGALGKVRPLICYEAIFPQEISSHHTPRPDWMLQITNDGWFGTLAGPQQHFQQARFRAIEQGLPLVRVANTGVSAVIDALGRVVARLPFGVAAKLDATLPGALPPTVYARSGDLPVFLLLLLGVAGVLVQRRKNND